MAESMIYGNGRVTRNEAKVSKFGDKMHGYLNYVEQLTDGEAPDANTWGLAGPRFYDTQNYSIGWLVPYFRPNGQQVIELYARRLINGANKGAYFGVGVDSSGNAIYDISDSDALRSAMGFWDGTTYASLAALITEISNNQASGSLAFYRCGTAIQFFNAVATLNSAAIIYKASTSNAYYLAFSRDKCSIGNISLANGTISVKHNIVT